MDIRGTVSRYSSGCHGTCTSEDTACTSL